MQDTTHHFVTPQGLFLDHGLTRSNASIQASQIRNPTQTLPCPDACNFSGRFLIPDGLRLLLCRGSNMGDSRAPASQIVTAPLLARFNSEE